VTRKCVVKFFKTELVQSKEVLEDIYTLFEKRRRKITKVNEDQALVPKIAQVIRNTKGTAPGAWIEQDNKIFVVMPGVPYEMNTIMMSYVILKLKEKIEKSEFITIRINKYRN